MTEAKKPAGKPAAAKSPRRRSREFALQGLYQWRIGGQDEAAIEAHMADVAGFDKADREFFVGLVRGALAQREALVAELTPFLDRGFGRDVPHRGLHPAAGRPGADPSSGNALQGHHQRVHRAGQGLRRHRRPTST